MSRHERPIRRILRGQSDANTSFADRRALLQHMRLDERIGGSHPYSANNTLWRRSTCSATTQTPCPIRRQVLRLILKYKLEGTNDAYVEIILYEDQTFVAEVPKCRSCLGAWRTRKSAGRPQPCQRGDAALDRYGAGVRRSDTAAERRAPDARVTLSRQSLAQGRPRNS